MTLQQPNESLLSDLLAEVLKGSDPPQYVGVRCQAWHGQDELTVQGRRCRLHWCPSTLAAREVLTVAAGDRETVVVLTDRDEDELGLDFMVRLASRRLLTVDLWRALERSFNTKQVDPRLRKQHSWLAQELLELPGEKLASPSTSMLDLQTAWHNYLQFALRLPEGGADIGTLLDWAATPVGPEHLRQLRAGSAEQVLHYLEQQGGPASAAVGWLARHEREDEAVPVGLVCRILFAEAEAEEPESPPALAAGAIRLEERVGGRSLQPADGLAWARAAEAWLRSQDAGPALDRVVQRAELLLRDLRIRDWAHRSTYLPSGRSQRAQEFAAALQQALASQPPQIDPRLSKLATRVDECTQARKPGDDSPHQAAIRLLRWLVREETAREEAVREETVREETVQAETATLEATAMHYAVDQSHVDLQRRTLSRSSTAPELQPSFDHLLRRVHSHREHFNQRFGQQVAAWFKSDASSPALLPLEDVLERVVAPLARQRPVLLLVLDGLTFSIFHELLDDFLRRGWEPYAERTPAERTPAATTPALPSLARIALAPLPSITEVCRASLFSGNLQTGGQALEKQAFAAHPALRACSKAKYPPVLLHKSELRPEQQPTSSLAAEAWNKIAGKDHQVVALVLNAIDDQLADGDQTLVRWSVDSMRHLEAILDAATAGERLIVLTSDHGHVEEWQLERAGQVVSGGGERYRPATAEATDELRSGELRIEGRRVLRPHGPGGAVVAPWSERIRYGQRKAGYHGGASPQELLLPLAVLSRVDPELERWQRATGNLPEWWQPAPAPAATVTKSTTRPKRRKTKSAPAQQGLFPSEAAEQQPSSTGTTETSTDIWQRLFASPTWRAQTQRAGGTALAQPEQVRPLLELLQQHGGRVSLTVLSRTLNLGLPRLRAKISQLQRLLNVEGYPVLDLEETTEELRLDLQMLREQFGVEP